MDDYDINDDNDIHQKRAKRPRCDDSCECRTPTTKKVESSADLSKNVSSKNNFENSESSFEKEVSKSATRRGRRRIPAASRKLSNSCNERISASHLKSSERTKLRSSLRSKKKISEDDNDDVNILTKSKLVRQKLSEDSCNEPSKEGELSANLPKKLLANDKLKNQNMNGKEKVPTSITRTRRSRAVKKLSDSTETKISASDFNQLDETGEISTERQTKKISDSNKVVKGDEIILTKSKQSRKKMSVDCCTEPSKEVELTEDLSKKLSNRNNLKNQELSGKEEVSGPISRTRRSRISLPGKRQSGSEEATFSASSLKLTDETKSVSASRLAKRKISNDNINDTDISTSSKHSKQKISVDSCTEPSKEVKSAPGSSKDLSDKKQFKNQEHNMSRSGRFRNSETTILSSGFKSLDEMKQIPTSMVTTQNISDDKVQVNSDAGILTKVKQSRQKNCSAEPSKEVQSSTDSSERLSDKNKLTNTKSSFKDESPSFITRSGTRRIPASGEKPSCSREMRISSSNFKVLDQTKLISTTMVTMQKVSDNNNDVNKDTDISTKSKQLRQNKSSETPTDPSKEVKPSAATPKNLSDKEKLNQSAENSKTCSFCKKTFSSAKNVKRHIDMRCPVTKTLGK
jgi:hypothetical protein